MTTSPLAVDSLEPRVHPRLKERDIYLLRKRRLTMPTRRTSMVNKTAKVPMTKKWNTRMTSRIYWKR